MPHIRFSRRELSVLASLRDHPLEIGSIPSNTVERFLVHQFAENRFGQLTITPRGQLEFHRQNFLKAPRQKLALVTSNRPVYLHETRFEQRPLSRARLMEFVRQRRMLDIKLRRLPALVEKLHELLQRASGKRVQDSGQSQA